MSTRKHQIALFVLFALVLGSCAPSEPTPTSPPSPTSESRPTWTPPPTATAGATATVEQVVNNLREGEPLPAEQGELFSTSGACVVCHLNQTDESGNDVSIDRYWRSTMMANAARDPYWQASVQAEIEELPDLAEIIEDSCSTCHMPMARYVDFARGETGKVFGSEGYLNPDHELHNYGMDGVSCALCHQIRADNLGNPDSYSGGFYIDTELRAPDRIIFGPYTIDENQSRIMQTVSGYRPEQGLHMSETVLCATCHTLYTPFVDANGEIAGEFPEQVPYIEWFYSDYRRNTPCQGCHLGLADGGVKISTTSDALRSPFKTHEFVGGNAYMLQILDRFGEEIGVTASSEDFEATIKRTVDQLQNDTAQISFEQIRKSGNWINADVVVENLAGHKFPTGFPARRAWLRFVVKDGNGDLVFESGAYRPDGSIVGNDNDEDLTQVEQHYEAIVQPDQVQIYEAILQDTENDVTTTLLRAASYRKDNRLLPSGFDKQSPYEDIAVRGGAREDETFDGGGDAINYTVDVGSGSGPYEVTVELLYQSIGYRWAENLRDNSGAEVERFLAFHDAVPNEPVVVATTSEILE